MDAGRQFIDILINAFNTTEYSGIETIVDSLKRIYTNELSLAALDENNTRRARMLAGKLIKLADNSKIIVNYQNFDNQFNKLGNLGFDNINEVYNLVDNLIYKVNGTIDWLSMYSELINTMINLGSYKQQHIALVKLAKVILAEANQLCPIDTGNLRKSGVVIDQGDKVIVAYTIDYATYVHEDLNARHKIGQAKFLEIAAQRVLGPRAIWTEHLGFGGVMIVLSLNNMNISPYNVEYSHYGSK